MTTCSQERRQCPRKAAHPGRLAGAILAAVAATFMAVGTAAAEPNPGEPAPPGSTEFGSPVEPPYPAPPKGTRLCSTLDCLGNHNEILARTAR